MQLLPYSCSSASVSVIFVNRSVLKITSSIITLHQNKITPRDIALCLRRCMCSRHYSGWVVIYAPATWKMLNKILTFSYYLSLTRILFEFLNISRKISAMTFRQNVTNTKVSHGIIREVWSASRLRNSIFYPCSVTTITNSISEYSNVKPMLTEV